MFSSCKTTKEMFTVVTLDRINVKLSKQWKRSVLVYNLTSVINNQIHLYGLS